MSYQGIERAAPCWVTIAIQVVLRNLHIGACISELMNPLQSSKQFTNKWGLISWEQEYSQNLHSLFKPAPTNTFSNVILLLCLEGGIVCSVFTQPANTIKPLRLISKLQFLNSCHSLSFHNMLHKELLYKQKKKHLASDIQ